MTIRQYLDRCARPYKRNMWICGIVFGIAGLCMVPSASHVLGLSDRTPAWQFWFWFGSIGVTLHWRCRRGYRIGLDKQLSHSLPTLWQEVGATTQAMEILPSLWRGLRFRDPRPKR